MTEQNGSLICLFLGLTMLLVSRLVDLSISRKGEIITSFERRTKLVWGGMVASLIGLFMYFHDRSTRPLTSSSKMTIRMSLLGFEFDQIVIVGAICFLLLTAGLLLSLARNDIATVMKKGPEIISESTIHQKALMLQVASRIFIAAGITGGLWLVFQFI